MDTENWTIHSQSVDQKRDFLIVKHVLKDGRMVTLRNLTIEDLDRSYRFFSGVPAQDRQ